jgi:hypothetical protein
MIKLKLFEDFGESSFNKIDANEWLDNIPKSIPLNKYIYKNMKQSLEKRLTKVFGHSDFFIEFDKKTLEYKRYVLAPDTIELIYIYERINTLAVYKIYLIEDEWFYISSENRGLVYTKPGFISYYEADDIRGIYDAIKYDYEISKKANIYCKLPARTNLYGSEGVKKQFFEAKGILLDTHKDFPIAEFPEEEVYRIIPDIYLPNDYDWGPFRHKEFLELKVDGKLAKLTWNKITIDLYYIKETNRFICADLLNWDYYACVGIEGLKRFLSVFFK